jgi:hypothetical protein
LGGRIPATANEFSRTFARTAFSWRWLGYSQNGPTWGTRAMQTRQGGEHEFEGLLNGAKSVPFLLMTD